MSIMQDRARDPSASHFQMPICHYWTSSHVRGLANRDEAHVILLVAKEASMLL